MLKPSNSRRSALVRSGAVGHSPPGRDSEAKTKNANQRALKKLCKDTGIAVSERDGKLVIAEDHVMGFLEVLDRRRYELELVEGSPERYRAGSRQKLRQ